MRPDEGQQERPTRGATTLHGAKSGQKIITAGILRYLGETPTTITTTEIVVIDQRGVTPQEQARHLASPSTVHPSRSNVGITPQETSSATPDTCYVRLLRTILGCQHDDRYLMPRSQYASIIHPRKGPRPAHDPNPDNNPQPEPIPISSSAPGIGSPLPGANRVLISPTGRSGRFFHIPRR